MDSFPIGKAVLSRPLAPVLGPKKQPVRPTEQSPQEKAEEGRGGAKGEWKPVHPPSGVSCQSQLCPAAWVSYSCFSLLLWTRRPQNYRDRLPTRSHQHPHLPGLQTGRSGGAGHCPSPSRASLSLGPQDLLQPALPSPAWVRESRSPGNSLFPAQGAGGCRMPARGLPGHRAGGLLALSPDQLPLCTHWSASAWPASLPGCWARGTRLLVVT